MSEIEENSNFSKHESGNYNETKQSDSNCVKSNFNGCHTSDILTKNDFCYHFWVPHLSENERNWRKLKFLKIFNLKHHETNKINNTCVKSDFKVGHWRGILLKMTYSTVSDPYRKLQKKESNLLHTYVLSEFLTANCSKTTKYFWKSFFKVDSSHLHASFGTFCVQIVNYLSHSEILNFRKNFEIHLIFLRKQRFYGFQTFLKNSLCLQKLTNLN